MSIYGRSNITGIFNYLDMIYGKSLSVGGVLRTDKFNYPVLALREGILNAIVHRDYNSIKGFLQISIYSDRTEISNFGGLPQGITLADLKIEHHSILRNPDIAQMCFIRKYIEMLGSGTLRMIKDCKENKFKTPVWKVKENITTVTFPDVAHNRKIEVTAKGITEGISRSIVAKVEGIMEGITEGITQPVKERLSEIVLFIYKHQGTKVADLMNHFSVSERTIKDNLKILTEALLIEYKGSKKAGYYELSKKLHDKLH